MSTAQGDVRIIGQGFSRAGFPVDQQRAVPRHHRRCTTGEFAEFARRVSSAADIRKARQAVVSGAAAMLETPWVGLTRHGPPREVAFVATSGDVVQRVARIAAGTHEGVCWQVYLGSDVVSAVDLSNEQRWPAYRRAVLQEVPVRSALGIALHVGERTEGALLLYSDDSAHFANGLLADAAILADHAALGLAHVTSRTKAESLEIALRSSREIAIAIGIIIERRRTSEERAFELLRAASQERHLKVRDLAARVVFTGELPDLPPETAADT